VGKLKRVVVTAALGVLGAMSLAAPANAASGGGCGTTQSGPSAYWLACVSSPIAGVVQWDSYSEFTTLGYSPWTQGCQLKMTLWYSYGQSNYVVGGPVYSPCPTTYQRSYVIKTTGLNGTYRESVEAVKSSGASYGYQTAYSNPILVG